MQEKKCSRCPETKPLTEFRPDAKSKDGRRAECAACTRAYMAIWREHNREKTRAYKTTWNNNNRPRLRQYRKNVVAKNPHYGRDAARKHQAKHPEKVKARHHNHFVKNREQYGQRYRTYQARKRAATIEPFTDKDWLLVVQASGHRCVYCGRRMKRLTQDHVIPISRGGTHSLGNVVPACMTCNRKKGNRTLEQAGMVMVIPLQLSLIPA
jgi:5-methylcytosine-specific restriction endonuclease McrA